TGGREQLQVEESSAIKIPACFSKMPQESKKFFPHTKQVGTYLVGRMINKGSFAKVMEGLHIPTGEKVAIKVIDKRKAKQDSYMVKNMKREPRIHQMIKHPNVVQLYETLETGNSYYMVMELCLGGDLLDRICDKQRLAEREVRRYTRQILSAVGYLHCHGIVHRDLKIENFLLDENNNIKIVDFGLSNTAKFEGLSQELLHTQCGSPAYAAPELLAHRKYGPKVDVWSIGVSMFAMLTGTLPFTVEPFNIKQLHQKMVIGEISPIPSDISPGAVHFMQSLLEPDPAKRPGVKEAMKDKWLNEGFTKKILNTTTKIFVTGCRVLQNAISEILFQKIYYYKSLNSSVVSTGSTEGFPTTICVFCHQSQTVLSETYQQFARLSENCPLLLSLTLLPLKYGCSLFNIKVGPPEVHSNLYNSVILWANLKIHLHCPRAHSCCISKMPHTAPCE
uniref:non-specific serine/threonine protein kinase n=1 Tax=Meleagris gallopavo TaxID=9103 RepID=G1NLS8_MELGA